MKILWLGDAGCHTGFARVTHAIGERLVANYDHEIHVLAVNYLGDGFDSSINPGRPTELRLYRPNTIVESDMHGRARFVELLGKIEPDVVVILNDPAIILRHLFGNKYDEQRILLRYRPLMAYVPCDGVNLPPAWPKVLGDVTKLVTMSAWGQSQYPGSEMVYHGVDHDQFWPVHERPIRVSSGDVLRTKRDCKRAFGFDPSGFLALRVDKNSGRKDFPATWKALVPVMRRYSDIQVHFHCEPSAAHSGVDLPVLYTREPTLAKDRFFGPDLHNSFQGWPVADLNALYNAADIFVTTSRGEGFGLTIAEALACGVPVIAQNVSAIPEVVGPGGILIEPERLITVPSGEDMWLPDIASFSQAIERLYRSAGARRDLGEAGTEHVRKSFNWDTAAAHFNDLIKELGSPEAVEPQLVTA
jgi:glycosyltransferase involved in cell wall biosynthesis